MTSESLGEDWRGDVGLGVDAWTRRAGRPPAADGAPEGEDVEPASEDVARKILLDQLTGRARTRHELATKLAQKNVPEELATSLLDRFEEVGLVDDAAFARSWVSSRQSGRGLAPRALAQELRRKGVADAVAREALEEVTEADQEAAARQLVRRKLRSMRGVDSTTATRRLAGLLARKGYAPGLAFAIVRSELATDVDDADLSGPDLPDGP